jgi:hypothetical protein
MQSILPTEVVSHAKEYKARKIAPPVRAGFYSWGRASRFNFGAGEFKGVNDPTFGANYNPNDGSSGTDGSDGTWLNPSDRSQDGGGWLNPVGPSLEPDGPLPDDFSFVASFLSTQEIWKGQEIFRKISLADEGVAGLAVPVEGLSLATFDLGVRKVETVEVKQVDNLTIIYPTIETRQEYLELGFPLIEVLSRGNAAPPDRPYPPMPPEIQAAPTLEKTYDWEPRDYSGESYALSQPDLPSTEAVVQLGAFRVPMRFTSGSEIMMMAFRWDSGSGPTAGQAALTHFYFDDPFMGDFGWGQTNDDFASPYVGDRWWPYVDDPSYSGSGIQTLGVHYKANHYDGTLHGKPHKGECMREEAYYVNSDPMFTRAEYSFQYWYFNLTNIYKDWVPPNPGDAFPRFINIRMKVNAPISQGGKVGGGEVKYQVFQKPPLSPALYNHWLRLNDGKLFVPGPGSGNDPRYPITFDPWYPKSYAELWANISPPEFADYLVYDSPITNIRQPATSNPWYFDTWAEGQPLSGRNFVDYAILKYDRVTKEIEIEYLI